LKGSLNGFPYFGHLYTRCVRPYSSSNNHVYIRVFKEEKKNGVGFLYIDQIEELQQTNFEHIISTSIQLPFVKSGSDMFITVHMQKKKKKNRRMTRNKAHILANVT
jgi:hypothetical protein